MQCLWLPARWCHHAGPGPTPPATPLICLPTPHPQENMPQSGSSVTPTLHPPRPIVTSFLSSFLAGLLWVTPVSSLNCPFLVPPLFLRDTKHNLNNLSPTAPVSPFLICPAPPLHCLAPPFLSVHPHHICTEADLNSQGCSIVLRDPRHSGGDLAP